MQSHRRPMAQLYDDPLFSSLEKERVRELYRYFPTTLDLHDRDADARITDQDGIPGGPRLAADPALTALAQLSALRVNCERAFISLIDSDEQHIVAEATRSISLSDNNRYAHGDALSFGVMKLDLMEGVCGGTIKVLTGNGCDGNIYTDNIYADQTRYVINDFTKEDRFKDRPYVAGFPHMRFYADLPITTDSGHVIGSLAVVDNKPRDGLSPDEYVILAEIASAIMSHLVLLSTRQEYDRAGRLLKGMKYFVQRDSLTPAAGDGKLLSELLKSHPWPPVLGTADNESSSEDANTPRMEASKTAMISDTTTTTSSESTDTTFGSRETSSTLLSPTITTPATTEQPQADMLLPSGDSLRRRDTVITSSAVELGGMPRSARDSFKNAANILSQAMDLDGVVFLDAATTDTTLYSVKPGQSDLLERPPQFPVSDSKDYDKAPREDPQSVPYMQNSSNETPAPVIGSVCTKLGRSVRARPGVQRSRSRRGLYSLPESLHQHLQNRHPRGAVLVLDRESDVQLVDKSQRPPSVKRRASMSGDSDSSIAEGTIQDFSAVEAALRSSFPDATSILYSPLWDPIKQRWAVGSFGWTSSPRRIFSSEEFAYFTAFGSLIMTEVTRLELAATDQMKSDFISSISHELRSPLHGILGSAELMLEEPISNGQRETLGMITKCGKSLLDTMEHILVYSKINAVARYRKSHLDLNARSEDQRSSDGAYESQSTFDLATLVEDTVETTAVGRVFSNPWFNEPVPSHGPSADLQNGSSAISDKSPSVLLAIDGTYNWLINSEAGAWRRILINLLGNSLKYTTTGFVEVSLRSTKPQAFASSGEAQRTITLSVKDTGRGISRAYLRNHLYTPFSQESTLSSGAGLGLSIVRQLVNSLSGKIDVQSEVGWGTCFVVSAPVTFKAQPKNDSVIAQLRPTAEGRTLCLLALDLYPELDVAPTGILSSSSRAAIAQKTAIVNQAQQWFGMKVTSAQTAIGIEADVVMVEEEKLHLLWPERRTCGVTPPVPGAIPLIVVCGENGPATHLQEMAGNVHHLIRPIGPRKFAKALAACLDAVKANKFPQMPAPIFIPNRSASAHRNPSPARASLDSNSTRASTLNGVAASSPDPNIQDTDCTAKRAHLLLVDDNAINLKILVACIKKLSCTYQTAYNGLEALEAYKASKRRFDFVFMDISMPVMDGYASTRAIRAFEKKRGLRPSTVIALTGLGSSEALREGQLSGMDQFLTKPLPMQRIKKIIEGSIAKDTARDAGAQG